MAWYNAQHGSDLAGLQWSAAPPGSRGWPTPPWTGPGTSTALPEAGGGGASIFGMSPNRFALLAGLVANALDPQGVGGRLGGSAARLGLMGEQQAMREQAAEANRRALLHRDILGKTLPQSQYQQGIEYDPESGQYYQVERTTGQPGSRQVRLATPAERYAATKQSGQYESVPVELADGRWAWMEREKGVGGAGLIPLTPRDIQEKVFAKPEPPVTVSPGHAALTREELQRRGGLYAHPGAPLVARPEQTLVTPEALRERGGLLTTPPSKVLQFGPAGAGVFQRGDPELRGLVPRAEPGKVVGPQDVYVDPTGRVIYTNPRQRTGTPRTPTTFETMVDVTGQELAGLQPIPDEPRTFLGFQYGTTPGRSVEEQVADRLAAAQTPAERNQIRAAYQRLKAQQPVSPKRGDKTSQPDGVYQLGAQKFKVRNGLIVEVYGD